LASTGVAAETTKRPAAMAKQILAALHNFMREKISGGSTRPKAY
jgi:hypothetical protein